MIKRRTPVGTPNTIDPFSTEECDLERRRCELVAFVRESVETANANGAVVAMSGGVDSTLTATLAVEALGPSAVRGLVLPWLLSAEANAVDAVVLADDLRIECDWVHLHPLVSKVPCVSASGPTDSAALGNAVARLRSAVVHFEAGRHNCLVIGTANRTERLLGYFTKHGDGAANVFPLGDCYKTEVRALADHIGVPARVITRSPTAGFRVGQTDQADLGAPYDVIDRVLTRLVDSNLGIHETAAELGIDVDFVRRLARYHLDAKHKRTLPPRRCIWSAQEEPTYFHELELHLG